MRITAFFVSVLPCLVNRTERSSRLAAAQQSVKETWDITLTVGLRGHSIRWGRFARPLTVIWEIGFLETVSRNIGSIFKTELFQELLKIVLRRAAKRLGVETGLEAPGKNSPKPKSLADCSRRQIAVA